MNGLSHIDESGSANMVDISAKAVSIREATAVGYLRVSNEVLDAIEHNTVAKGDVLSVARIAGIQGAKRCADLIPLCHPLALSKVDIHFDLNRETSSIRVQCYCKLSGKTGVEMEALTGVNIALLTLFDMCKALDPNMVIDEVKVLEKKGGKHGEWRHPIAGNPSAGHPSKQV